MLKKKLIYIFWKKNPILKPNWDISQILAILTYY